MNRKRKKIMSNKIHNNLMELNDRTRLEVYVPVFNSSQESRRLSALMCKILTDKLTEKYGGCTSINGHGKYFNSHNKIEADDITLIYVDLDLSLSRDQQKIDNIIGVINNKLKSFIRNHKLPHQEKIYINKYSISKLGGIYNNN